MKKQKRQLLILLIALVVLAGGYFGLVKYNESQVEEEIVEETVYLIDIDKNSINRIQYSYKGEEYAFIKEDDTWKYEADTSLELNQDMMKIIQGYAARITVEQTIENVEDLSLYGLDEPERYISWETADKTYIYNIGVRSAYRSDYYICEPGSNTVYIIPSTTVTVFDKTLMDLRK